MHTGADDISQFGTVKYWNYNDRTNYFAGKCGEVYGSAGEFYPPNQTKNKPISFFSPDMCRSISLDFSEEVSIDGVTGYKYSGGKKTVDNGTAYPENKCFTTGKSVPSGVLNVTSCRNAPVFMSFPHFYGADPYYLNQVEGMQPKKEDHEFYITLEPKTGIPIEVAARFQVNALIRPVENIGLYRLAPYMFFPVLWFEQKVRISSAMTAEIKTVLKIPTIGFICFVLMIAIGVVMIMWRQITRWLCGRTYETEQDSCSLKSVNVEKLAYQGSPDGSPLIKLKNVEMKFRTDSMKS